MFETTKRNSWVDKDLTENPKKKGFQKNGAVQNGKKNRTRKKKSTVEDA